MRPRLSTLGLFLALAANAGCAAAEPSTFTPRADDWRQLRGDYVLDNEIGRAHV